MCPCVRECVRATIPISIIPLDYPSVDNPPCRPPPCRPPSHTSPLPFPLLHTSPVHCALPFPPCSLPSLSRGAGGGVGGWPCMLSLPSLLASTARNHSSRCCTGGTCAAHAVRSGVGGPPWRGGGCFHSQWLVLSQRRQLLLLLSGSATRVYRDHSSKRPNANTEGANSGTSTKCLRSECRESGVCSI